MLKNGARFLRYTVWKVSVFGVFLVRIFPYSVRMLENTDQRNSEYEHFSRSGMFSYLALLSMNGLKTSVFPTELIHFLKSKP